MSRRTRVLATYWGIGVVLFCLVAGVAAAAEGTGGLRGDSDGDAALSRDEFLADAGRRFERYDRDKDGVVLRADVERAADEAARRIKARLLARFAREDRDGDGRLTRAEADAVAAGRFGDLDADGDGRVVRADFRRRPQAKAVAATAQ